MGCVSSRPASHASPLARLSSLISSLAWHLSSLLNNFYNLHVAPLLNLDSPSAFYSRPSAGAGESKGILPVRYRPDKRFRQQMDVERRRRRATEAAEKAGEGLLNHVDDDDGETEACHGLDGELALTPLESDSGHKAAKRRSAPPRYAPRSEPNVLTSGEPSLLIERQQQQQQRRTGPISGHDHAPPLAKVQNRAVTMSDTAPVLTRPSPAFLLEEDNKPRRSNKTESATPSASPRGSMDVRRQALAFSNSQSAYNMHGTRPPSLDFGPTGLPLSRTATALSGTGLVGEGTPRTSISDMASAACSRKNAAKERKLWREEIDKVAKRKVVGWTGGGGGGGGGGAGAGAGQLPAKRSSLGPGAGAA
ncbi:hypothetical protein BCV69DRAFT_85577 [Microstroma glucosiphilum]|uniref:Uncharacterized protein n=1 Tax=Pseudomicrostroma glucosiphilum TaxID=1684307 RepID=A0A316U0T5_9BASI|nr:hypothetical protein BCV69DRAFT_85577 [Pseudomicrostroma glucosiphilum]PWN18121.1 hypothetical protein BCV69DRAFT_85577 [Pseudomicrostroma glucosiphilum]